MAIYINLTSIINSRQYASFGSLINEIIYSFDLDHVIMTIYINLILIDSFMAIYVNLSKITTYSWSSQYELDHVINLI